jgi:hypothetical protein
MKCWADALALNIFCGDGGAAAPSRIKARPLRVWTGKEPRNFEVRALDGKGSSGGVPVTEGVVRAVGSRR